MTPDTFPGAALVPRLSLRFLAACVLALASLLAGCQSLHGRLSAEQIQALKEGGFVETEDGWTLNEAVEILFALNQAKLSEEGARKIDKLGKMFIAVKLTRLKVAGYTDSLGDAQYNLRLSERRAQAVVDALAQSGLPRSGLQAIGMGEHHPVASNNTRQGRAQNRHVSIIVVLD